MDISKVGTSGGEDSPSPNKNNGMEREDPSGSANRKEGNQNFDDQQSWQKLLVFTIVIFALIAFVYQLEQDYR